MPRHPTYANVEWRTPDGPLSWEQVTAEILMDIRAELRAINRTLQCPAFQRIPQTLRGIQRKLPTPPQRKP